MADRWNHNIHYGRRLLGLVPSGARDALDVGCGEGWLVRELRQRVGHVVGIDPDACCIAAARASGAADGVEYLQGVVATRAHRRTRTCSETPAPKIWPPPHTYGELRHLSSTVLPGRQFRRGTMWRYVLTWTKPAA